MYFRHLGVRGKLPPRETSGQISGTIIAHIITPSFCLSHVLHAWARNTLLGGWEAPCTLEGGGVSGLLGAQGGMLKGLSPPLYAPTLKRHGY